MPDMPEWVGLLILAGAVIVTVWHRNRKGRDAEIDRVLAKYRKQRRSWRTGLAPSLSDLVISRAMRRLD